MACVTTVNYTILFNGGTSVPFNAAKGLRQADPISPFLFAISMEYLSRCLNGLKLSKEFKFHPRCAKIRITHLCFANDLLLFSRGDLSSIIALQNCFLTFSQASRLQPNLGKIYWQPLIEKITTRITTWTTRKLSYTGRTQLFSLPAHVIKTIDAFCRSYSWFASNVITKKALITPSPKQSVIRNIYLQLLILPRVHWKTLVFKSSTRPKAQFTMWLHLQGRLLTMERLAKWRIHNVFMLCGLREMSEYLKEEAPVESLAKQIAYTSTCFDSERAGCVGQAMVL
ncbi:uncharacterized protein LOC132038412 [Lycium ferocissimum]|uniref:uncharacterized protein LOC132038412 n=1 Tax=Lycium ferocissimum TaxID=112874 RepID=UPI00281683AA|nr:uncharacterized protein LOC132038412 [Lycium ferocissimum]